MGILTATGKGATSLVDLILKKFGNDADGATQELVRIGGYPESVARRIATGELPMDSASVAKRADDQGYGDELYHGSTHDIKEFNTGRSGSYTDWGDGTYLTDSADDASKNYAGEGSDLTARLYRRAENMWLDAHDFSNAADGKVIGGRKFTEDEWRSLDYEGKQKYLRDDARAEIKGPHNGAVYPVRVKQDGLLSVTDEFPDEAWEEIGGVMGKYDIAGDIMPSEHQAQFVGRIIEENASRMTPDEIATLEKYAPQGHTGIVDTTTADRYSQMGAGNHTIMLPGSENQIRSVNAAFDPQYKGSNIMGSAALPVAAGLLAAGQSEDSEAGLAAPMVKDSGFISAPRSEGLMDFTMGARGLERRLEGSPASLLFPSGLIDYLETTNRRTEDPNAMTRAMALMDFF